MIQSEVVEQQYRLQFDDLPEGGLTASIANVSYQGLERLYPVLHLHGQTKALVMTRRLCMQIVELTGSVVAEDWIGRTVHLRSIRHGGDFYIVIDTGTRARPLSWLKFVHPISAIPVFVRVALFIALLGLLSWLYTMQNWDTISEVLSRLFS